MTIREPEALTVNDVAPAEASELRHLYLIDGSGFIFRAFHALPPLTRSDGTPVNAVLGFSNMLWKILRETDADHAAVIFDTARLTFRNEIYEPYKANRGETPEELIPQFPLVREAAAAFNLASIELEGFEADDLIAAYASRRAGAGRAGHHRLRRQGPDATRRDRFRGHVRLLQEPGRSARTRCMSALAWGLNG